MKSIIKLIILLLFVFIIVFGVKKVLVTKGALTQETLINSVTSEIEKDVITMNSFEEQNNADAIYSSSPQLEILNKNKKPEYVAKFLFGAASLQDKELFSSSFDFETLNKDLFSVENPNKEAVLDEMMNRLTRNQTLTSVNVLTVIKKELETTVDVTVRLIYDDGLKKNVELSMIPTFTEHFDVDGIFSVSTSGWAIIQQVERE